MVVARLQDEDPSGGPLYQRILREFVLGDGGEISEGEQQFQFVHAKQ